MSAIPRGTQVWRFTPPFDQHFDPDEIAKEAPHVVKFFDHFGYLDRNSKRLVLCFDDARFTNHSLSPNIGMVGFDEDPFGIDVALRDIAAGEEILCNYDDFEEGGSLWASPNPPNASR